jgi:hypothetical protein
MSLNTRVHNKSGLSGLSFLERDDKLITSWVMELKRTAFFCLPKTADTPFSNVRSHTVIS